MTSLGISESKSYLKTCKRLILYKAEQVTFKFDFCFLGHFDQVAFERYSCSTLHLQNFVEGNFHFLTQPQRSRVQGQSCVVFVLQLLMMATVIIAQPPWVQHLSQELLLLTKQVSEHRKKGRGNRAHRKFGKL